MPIEMNDVGQSEVKAATKTFAKQKKKQSRILMCVVCVLVAAAVAVCVMLLVGGKSDDNSSGSTDYGELSFNLPGALKMVDMSSSSSGRSATPLSFNIEGMEKVSAVLRRLGNAANAKLQASDYDNYVVDTNEDIAPPSQDGNSFTGIISFANMIVCVISKVATNDQRLWDNTQYYGATVDTRLCGNEGGENNTRTELEWGVQVTDNGPTLTATVYSPGFLNGDSSNTFTLYGTLTTHEASLTGGFDFSYWLDSAYSSDYSGDTYTQTSLEKASLSYHSESKYSLYVKSEKFKQQSQNSGADTLSYQVDVTEQVAVEDKKAFIEQTSVVSNCLTTGSMSSSNCQGEANVAYLMTYDDVHLRVQNCTESCTDYANLPFVLSGDDTSSCYLGNVYTEYAGGYSLFDSTTGTRITVPNGVHEMDVFYFNWTDAANRVSGSTASTFDGKKTVITASQYGSNDVWMEVTACDDGSDVRLHSSIWRGSTYFYGYCATGSEIRRHIGRAHSANNVDLADGTILGSAKVKAGEILRVLKQTDASACASLPLALPATLTYHTTAPAGVANAPSHYRQICFHNDVNRISRVDGVDVATQYESIASDALFTPSSYPC